MVRTSGGTAALATQLERQAMEHAMREIEALDIGAEVTGADMEVIAAWGARMYLLGLADRAAVARPAPAPAPEGPPCAAPACGHAESAHGAGGGACLASAIRGGRRRCACQAYTPPPARPSSAGGHVVRRRPASDRREIVSACKAGGHRTPGADGLCACGAYAIDDTRGGGGR